ncbi:PAS domain S-box protein [Dongia sedimenti]|uniref:histidine kinase n=1 Tax=Dongia sedimenti TaxID=3064282 RepID=A0ABU0YPE1_9PROT|nr:PAS domain S-box protein [Rhodospirillaceae bacterium R-7]
MRNQSEDRRSHGNDLLRAVVDTTVDGMIIIDRAGVVRIFNRAACDLFGYTAQEVVGHNVAMLMPPGDREHHDDYMQRYHASGQRRIIGIGREVQGQRKDGTVFPMNLAVGEIKGGTDYAYVGVVRDLTAQKHSYGALAEATSRAELASAAKTQFLSRMSHELRTPMNAVLGFAQLLRMAKPAEVSETHYNEYLDAIVGASKHLVALIDDILEFARVDGGALRFQCRALNLAQAVAEAIRMTLALAERLGVTVINRVEDAEGDLTVQADPVRLRQCIVNLLTNAIKYNRAAGQVYLDALDDRRSEGLLQLAVRDTGVGIPEARVLELFRPFTRLHPELEHVEGAGIGLAITKQLIEAMGGGVSVKSTVGVGSTFFLDIPLASRIEKQEERKAAFKPRKIVLYVEDNPKNVHLMESLMRQVPGVELKVAYSAELGLEIARSHPVRVIILDITLPGMDGFQALQQLRARRDTADVPVIGLSARASNADIERAAELGFYRYLTKPVNVPELMDTLRAVL